MIRYFAGFACLIVFAFSTVCRADDPAVAAEVIRIWPSEPPKWNSPNGPEQDTSKPDSGQVAGRTVIRLGNVSTPELHVFPAEGNAATDNVVVIAPGGGYSILAWDLEGTEIAEWLQSIGVSAAVLKYRVPTRNEEQKWLPAVQDLQRSIALLRGGAVAGLEPKRVGVLGFSAGGNASAHAATADKRHYTPIDDHDATGFLPDFAVLVYPAWLVKKDNLQELDDDLHVTDATPPIFFAHARDDRVTCMSSVTLFAELQKRNIPAELHIFGGGGHGFGLRKNEMAEDAWPTLCEAWMRERGWLTK